MTNEALSFALYDAFSDVPFGGSQAAVVSNAQDLGAGTRRRIAREVGVPATAFVTSCAPGAVSARFESTVMELPMCGHGTVGLMTRLVETGGVRCEGGDLTAIDLLLPSITARVEIDICAEGRPRIMLDVRIPGFREAPADISVLMSALELSGAELSKDFPLQVAVGDFVHLIVPTRGLDVMSRIAPDSAGVKQFCLDNGIETVAVFCTEVETPGHTIHVRDFCPAVGVPESAAAGTTNAAIATYLIRYGMAKPNARGGIEVQAEQGLEIGRPSSVRCVATPGGAGIARLQVGGIATKVMEGQLYVPKFDSADD